MDRMSNPFAPGAGNQPPELAGRDDILERTRVTLGRLEKGRHAKSFLLVGLRGVGKTVLLNKVSETALKSGFISVMIEASENKSLPDMLIPHLRKILLQLDTKEKVVEAVKFGLMALRSFASSFKFSANGIDLGLSVEPAKGIADTGDIEFDLPDLFEAIGRAAQAKGKVVAIVIDELQYINEKEFGALITAVHRVSQKNLPLTLVGAGLPQLAGLAGKAKSYSERLFDYPRVEALSDVDAGLALTEPARREGVEFSDKAVRRILTLTQGYPYFIQEWGYHTWNKAKSSPIKTQDVDAARDDAIRSMDDGFFRVRFDRVTPRERSYMFAMAHIGLGPHRSGEIATELGVTVESIAPVRKSLIKKGMVYSPAHGDTAFTVPMFNEYLERVQG